jgi:hypothetical protein
MVDFAFDLDICFVELEVVVYWKLVDIPSLHHLSFLANMFLPNHHLLHPLILYTPVDNLHLIVYVMDHWWYYHPHHRRRDYRDPHHDYRDPDDHSDHHRCDGHLFLDPGHHNHHRHIVFYNICLFHLY